MKNDRSQEIASGPVVKPSQEDGNRNQEHDTNQKVLHKRETKRAVKIQRCVPQGPRQPDQPARHQRREASRGREQIRVKLQRGGDVRGEVGRVVAAGVEMKFVRDFSSV